jgi:hypothetical protein
VHEVLGAGQCIGEGGARALCWIMHSVRKPNVTEVTGSNRKCCNSTHLVCVQVVHEVLGAGQCVGEGGARALVLDVGANFGVFALYAAMEGCRSVVPLSQPAYRTSIRPCLSGHKGVLITVL